MYTKVVVPLDGSELAETALPYARLLAGALSTDIELVEAYDVLPPAVHDHHSAYAVERMLEEARRRSEIYLAGVRDGLKAAGHTVTTATLPGLAEQVIVGAVGRDPGALLVMSTHGRGGIVRWALGSVADRVLHSISNPVLLIRAGAGRPSPTDVEIKKVLAPLDGSELSELSLPHAASLATVLWAEIELLMVSPTADVYRHHLGRARPGTADRPGPDRMSPEELVRADGERARAYLDRSKRRLWVELSFAGAMATSQRQGDHIAEVIMDVAEDEPTLVVMSTHGRGGVNRLLMGSVADRVVRHCAAPVLLVRERDEPDHAMLVEPAAGNRSPDRETAAP